MQKLDLEPIHKISGQVPVLVFTQLDGSSSVGSPRSLKKRLNWNGECCRVSVATRLNCFFFSLQYSSQKVNNNGKGHQFNDEFP